MQTTKKIGEEIDKRFQNKPLWGRNSFTLHNWTILGWYKWQDLLSIYMSLRGFNIIRAYITIIL